MKSILIIDTPNDCYDCPLYYEDRNECEATWEKVKDVDIEKPSWCPLRPLPKVKRREEEVAKDPVNEDLFYDDFINGWNACLDAITGETE